MAVAQIHCPVVSTAAELDNSDAASITSDTDAPAAAPSCQLTLWYIYGLPQADPLRALIARMQPALPHNSAHIVDGICHLLAIAKSVLNLSSLSRKGLIYCTRVLAFYQQVIDSGVASINPSAPRPALPGTVASFVLQSLSDRLARFGHSISEEIEQMRRYDHTTEGREQLQMLLLAALDELKRTLFQARQSLGLVSTAHRIAYSYLYEPGRHPFVTPTLRAEFSAHLRKPLKTFQGEAVHLQHGQDDFPDLRFQIQLRVLLRKLNFERDDRIEDRAQDEDGDVHLPDAQLGDGAVNIIGSDTSDVNQAGGMLDEDNEDEEEYFTPESYMEHVEAELDLGCLSFSGIQELKDWRIFAFNRILKVQRRIDECGIDALSEPNAHRLLVLLMFDMCAMRCVEQAAAMAELLVIYYRHRLASDPQPGHTHRFELSLALGALSMILTKKYGRRSEAILAAEEAKALFESTAGQFEDAVADGFRGLFALAYSQALVDNDSFNYIGAKELFHARKALRSAMDGTTYMTSLFLAHPESETTRAAQAHALFTSAKLGLNLLQVLQSLRAQHRLCDFERKSSPAERAFGTRTRRKPAFHSHQGSCGSDLQLSRRQDFHKMVDDYSLGTVQDFARMTAQAAGIYRELAVQRPQLYAPLLAAALKFQAELLELQPARAIPVYKEAIEVYKPLGAAFPNSFKERIAILESDLCHHLRSELRFEEACSALSRAIESQKQLRHHVCISRGLVDIPYLHAARSMAYIQLERYPDAMQEAMAAKKDSHPAHVPTREADSVEGEALSGFVFWKNGEPELALERLEGALEIVSLREQSAATAATAMARARARRNGPREREEGGRSSRRESDPNCILWLGWMGAIRAALGGEVNTEAGEREGAEAVRQAVALLARQGELRAEDINDDDEDGEGNNTRVLRLLRDALVPLEVLYPHLLVLHAATLTQLGRTMEAMGQVDKALQHYASDARVARDGSSVKTALLLRAKLRAEGMGEEEIAGGIGMGIDLEVDPAFQGFLAQLGCSQQN
ncbi:hypothetical protein OC842_002467 [Tilletia horrida]|uniref:Anaphase-promoting complex subunit 5 n=1 Tax=Tilletia horrida TaxID=155126 RepID=A0AAN6JL33_9BASI|nr:hypothetical protein OC842_002467 [Tilletia horrida]